MRKKLATANKALVAAGAAALTAAAPAVIDALNDWVAAVVGVIFAGAATYAVRNRDA